jgi:hypothetical protein
VLKVPGCRDDLECMASRTLNLRRPDVCAACGAELPSGSKALWNAATRTVTCQACTRAARASRAGEPEPGDIDRGQPGSSVAREHERRRQAREQRTRHAHPRIGGLLLALRPAPQHETAFGRGELGELAVAESLERRTADTSTILLHDRRMPTSAGNIDHLAIAPAGVFVIDAKNYRGKVEVRKPLLGAPKPVTDGRDRTNLIDGLDRQVAAVETALRAHGQADVPLRGVLCFTTAELPLLGTLKMRGHVLLYREALAKRLNAEGPLDPATIEELTRVFADALPPA